VILAADATGQGDLLHHHSLIEHGPPLWLAVALFLLGWQVMVAGMMIPASGAAIGRFVASAQAGAHQGREVIAFVGTYFAVSSVFGLACFAGDFVLHHLVDATSWLADRSWLVQAGVVGLAGAYQLLPLKRRFLDACRDPDSGAHAERGGASAGAIHAIECLGSSWAQMLLMFAAGFANVWWMLALTGVMVYETRGRYGRAVASLTGVVLLALAVAALIFHGLPAWPAG
jgi:predicted metal-binding membrane protein